MIVDEPVRIVIRENDKFITLVGKIHIISKNHIIFFERGNEIEWKIKKDDIKSYCKHEE